MRTARAVAFIVCCAIVALAIGVPALRAQRRTDTLEPARQSARQKIREPLMTEVYRRRGDAAARGVSLAAAGVGVDRHGRAMVDVRARISDPLTKKIGALGGRVVTSRPQYDQVIALMPVTMIERLANDPSVRSIDVAKER